MLARDAGNVFWLSRYLERAEVMARLMTVHDNLLLDLPDVDRTAAWLPLIAINSSESLFADLYPAPTEHNLMEFLIANPDNPSSIASSINGIRYNLRSSRAIIPQSLYELINELCLSSKSKVTTGMTPINQRSLLRSIEHQLLAISGACNGSMSYNQAFLFMRMGCFLERADMTTRLIDVRSGNLLSHPDSDALTPYDNQQWLAVLKSMHASQMYLAEVRQPINGPEVLAFVLQNQEHPRSFHFCVNRLGRFVESLPSNESISEKVQALLEVVNAANIRALAQSVPDLHQFIDGLQLQLASLGSDIGDHYFPAVSD